MTSLAELKAKWMKDPEVRQAYEEMRPEFELANALITARVNADLTQEEVARRMGTSLSTVERLERGGSLPSFENVNRYARAIGARPVVTLLPE